MKTLKEVNLLREDWEKFKKELRRNFKFNVKKHYSLLVYEAAIDKVLRKEKS